MGIIPIILLILPSDYFNTGRSICISKTVFDVECFGCGMTRAVQHLIHFQFEEAWHFNKLSFIVTPLIIFLWIKHMLKIYKKIKAF